MNDELAYGEPHPSTYEAFKYVKSQLIARPHLLESVASAALFGNRLAEICYGTMKRIMEGGAVSDRYVIALAWMLRKIENDELQR